MLAQAPHAEVPCLIEVERKRRAIEDTVRTEMVDALKNNEATRKDVAAEVGALIDATLAKRVRDASAHLI